MRATSLVSPSPVHAEESRAALLERWLLLTRTILPAMAAEEHWPISLDHCFMRVCLDDAMGRPWTEVVERPAIATMSDTQLAAAVRTAEGIVAHPDSLGILNDRSLERRRKARRSLLLEMENRTARIASIVRNTDLPYSDGR